MAKKMDRFGWDRDRGTAAHDRLVMDWMDRLQDYPLSEVQAACRKWLGQNPNKMANEGGIEKLILQQRGEAVLSYRASVPQPEPVVNRGPLATSEERAAIMKQHGYNPDNPLIKRMEASK